MRCYGLIGFPLTHSFSPAFFSEKFKRDLQPTPQYCARRPAVDSTVTTDGKY